MCLAHLAALSHLMSQADPASSATMNGLYALTLDKLGNLSLEVHIEEYSNLDLLTGVSIFIFPIEVTRLPSYSSGADFLEKSVGHHRRPHRIAPRRR